MKPTPFPDTVLEFSFAHDSKRVVYCKTTKLLTFTPAASGQVIRLIGEWPCTSICVHDHQNITLDLEEFTAPDLTQIVGNKTLDIYNWKFKKTYAPHESGTLISTVRNIYNSTIDVARLNDPFDSENHTIGEIYGNMRFCKLELDAPDGCKCIGAVRPGARICANNIFSTCPDDIKTEPCADLSVTLNPRGFLTTIKGLPLTFIAKTNIDANITFYVNGNEIHSETETREASYTPDRDVAAGEYDIKVVAADVNNVHYTDDDSCRWTVEALPLVTMHCHSGIDHIGSVQIFSATISTASIVTATLIPNGNPLKSYDVLTSRRVVAGEKFTFPLDSNDVGVGTHTIMVRATSISNPVSGFGTCTWEVRPPWPQLYMECQGPSEVGMPPTFTAFIDREAEITIEVRDDQDEEVVTALGNGSSFSFTPEGIVPGTYTVIAWADDELLGQSNLADCTWVVEEKLLWRETPNRELVIDVLINGKARHQFMAKTNKDNIQMDLVAVNLADNSKVNSLVVKDSKAVSSDIEVDEAGIYRVTATVEFPNGPISVSWDWVVREDVTGSCSTRFLYDGPHIENGYYIHLCMDDILNHFNPLPNIITGPFTAVMFTEDILEYFEKKPLPLPAKDLLKLVSKLLTIWNWLQIAVFFMYWCAPNLDDGSLDIFIPFSSLDSILEEIWSDPSSFGVRVGNVWVPLV